MRWLLVLSLTGLAACSSGDGQPQAERALPEPITLSSPAFTEGAAIPQRFTCDGDNLSPPLRWSELPTGTVEVALVVDDPDAPRGTDVHWVVVGLDPASTKLAEGMVPPGARQLRNSAGKAAYTGPCPPGGPPHHYRFTIYALQRPPEVGDDARPEAAIQAIGAAATARGRLVGTYGRRTAAVDPRRQVAPSGRRTVCEHAVPDGDESMALRKPSPRAASAPHPARHQLEQDDPPPPGTALAHTNIQEHHRKRPRELARTAARSRA